MQAAAVTRPHVLVVDDDVIFRTATVAALTKLDFRVTEARDGQEALAAFAAEPAGVVLMDAQMPEMDGFDACRQLRSMPGGEVVPVLMLTALDDESSIKAAYEAGATDFHSKPPRWSILGQRVRFMLRAANMREDLERSRAESAQTQRIARLGHWEWDLATQQITVSTECARLLRRQPETVALDLDEFLGCFHKSDRAALLALGSSGNTPEPGGSGTFELECRVPARPVPRIVRVEAAPVRGAHGETLRINAVMQDVTESRMAEERIRYLAHFDPLTGLVNRSRFSELVAEAIGDPSTPRDVALILIDLRRLAQVNDVLGIAAGDSVLREASTRIGTGLAAMLRQHRKVRGTVGRQAGNEFGVLLSGAVTPTLVQEIGERIIKELRSPFDVEGREIIVRANAGFAMCPSDASDVDELLKQADHGLIVAKAGSIGMVSRCPVAPTVPTADRLFLETELHYALDRREMVLHYQPQIDVRTGRVVSAEALIRWRRDGVLVQPNVFVPVAEETGLIEGIQEWVILAACWQYRLWREAGLTPVPIAVNLTASHFLSPSLIDVVSTALAETGCPPGHLELEITESVLLHDVPKALAQIAALSDLGVRFSMDDFGTGYSSLSYLRSLPIDRLKIDRSFVSDLGSSRDAEVLVGTMIGMSRGLGLKVVAEGVETRAQAELLIDHGCPVMQGFLFARPMPASQLQTLLQQPRPEHWKMPRARPRPTAVHLGETIGAA